DMYDHMSLSSQNFSVDRGIALHKMIRLLTASMHNGGYLNFMGNEFGHPEWIDFPREGNDWSYKYARRQWNLADDDTLKYKLLGNFDAAMIDLLPKSIGDYEWMTMNDGDQVLAYVRNNLLFVYNFNPVKSFTDYGVVAAAGDYKIILSGDDEVYGGHNRIDTTLTYSTTKGFDTRLRLYLPARTALVLQKID
ncbi:MAG: 1,4-alpha-glucan-branching enzyme, partial [Alcaligenaceae bacterium]